MGSASLRPNTGFHQVCSGLRLASRPPPPNPVPAPPPGRSSPALPSPPAAAFLRLLGPSVSGSLVEVTGWLRRRRPAGAFPFRRRPRWPIGPLVQVFPDPDLYEQSRGWRRLCSDLGEAIPRDLAKDDPKLGSESVDPLALDVPS
ncbi:hypothetical protein ACP70R_014512 [Stipagrostis hirtigluma subsp. patula]